MSREFKEIMKQLSEMGDDKRIKYNKKLGADDNQFGIAMGKLRALAKQIKTNHTLALELWESRNYDAMVLAAMLFDSKLLREHDFEELIKDAYTSNLVDELIFRVLSLSSYAKQYLKKWAKIDDDRIGQGGWDLAVALLIKGELPDDEIEELLVYIEEHLAGAPAAKQWAMNRFLCEVGIRDDKYTDRCIAMGEKLGIYKELKVAKGCTSAYAPEWIQKGIENRRKANNRKNNH